MSSKRLDSWLVELGHFASREQAQKAIRAGDVCLNDRRIDKPGFIVTGQETVRVQTRSQYVSRGGYKLAGALDQLAMTSGWSKTITTGQAILLEGRICLDGGISTGGFTDCLLQRGAAHVFGVDVGYGQVAWSLQTDARVTIHERTNLRYLSPAELYGDLESSQWPDFATVDVSFIPLAKVLPALWSLLQPPREVLLLVKPQFEVGRERLGKKGVVRDPKAHADAIYGVWQAAAALGWQFRGLTWSPIQGPAGNTEFWLWLAMNGTQVSLAECCELAQTASQQFRQSE